eukprot:9265389-Pyramimonas_sp.AAC.1
MDHKAVNRFASKGRHGKSHGAFRIPVCGLASARNTLEPLFLSRELQHWFMSRGRVVQPPNATIPPLSSTNLGQCGAKCAN